jgi:hypothetical protein
MITDALRARLDDSMTEAQFMEQVVEYAHLRGWRVCHFRPGRTASGWRTAVSYDAEGWPDLLLVRERVVIAELKSQHRKLSTLQRDWHSKRPRRRSMYGVRATGRRSRRCWRGPPNEGPSASG